jgi:hypothetical protein
MIIPASKFAAQQIEVSSFCNGIADATGVYQ